ncbi:MAG: glutathione S-transferase family protein [Deltaproteobacteria bacterium]
MSDIYRIFGSENSPYSIKVRAYYRYKGIAHEWILRTGATMEEYKKYARLPIVPAVATPEDKALQDSTPIIEEMERRFPEPSIQPADPVLRFLAELIEEFGDEWANKWMFHYRWAREVDQKTVARRLVTEMMGPEASEEQIAPMAEQIQARMSGRGFAVGSNEKTAGLLEDGFREGIALLEAHLTERPWLFGTRPSIADLSLGAQIYEALIDPTAGAILREQAPRTAAWSERSLEPTANGTYESMAALAPTLDPLLAGPVRFFLAWSNQNAQAIADGAEEFSFSFAGRDWWQTVGGPQKYHAKSLKVLKQKYAETSSNAELAAVLERSGLREFLVS